MFAMAGCSVTREAVGWCGDLVAVGGTGWWLLDRSARSGAFHSLLNRRGGYFLQWLRLRVAACLERAPAFVH